MTRPIMWMLLVLLCAGAPSVWAGSSGDTGMLAEWTILAREHKAAHGIIGTAGWTAAKEKRRIAVESKILSKRLDLALFPKCGYPQGLVKFSYKNPTTLRGRFDLAIVDEERITGSLIGSADKCSTILSISVAVSPGDSHKLRLDPKNCVNPPPAADPYNDKRIGIIGCDAYAIMPLGKISSSQTLPHAVLANGMMFLRKRNAKEPDDSKQVVIRMKGGRLYQLYIGSPGDFKGYLERMREYARTEHDPAGSKRAKEYESLLVGSKPAAIEEIVKQLIKASPAPRLEGDDADKNGIRDDVDVFINDEFKSSAKLRAALRQVARYLQKDLSPSTDKAVFGPVGDAISCLNYVLGDKKVAAKAAQSYAGRVKATGSGFGGTISSTELVNEMKALTFNTQSRFRAHLDAQSRLSGGTYELKFGATTCAESVDAMPD